MAKLSQNRDCAQNPREKAKQKRKVVRLSVFVRWLRQLAREGGGKRRLLIEEMLRKYEVSKLRRAMKQALGGCIAGLVRD